MDIGIPCADYSIVCKRFDDFEAFFEAIRAWDLNFRQLDRGQSTAELSQTNGAFGIWDNSPEITKVCLANFRLKH